MNGNHIKSVKIENFANHKDTFVTLEPGTNIITGTSDSGKTAFVRALMFVLDNMSSGTSYVNKLTKAKFAKVTVEFTDGRILFFLICQKMKKTKPCIMLNNRRNYF